MAKFLSDLTDLLIPSDEANAQAVRAYRLRVALVACSAWLTLCMLVLPALFVGLPMVGQLAWSSDIERVTSERVASAVEPIQQDLAELRTEVRAQTVATNALLAELAHREIFDLTRRRCVTTDGGERDRLLREIKQQAARYRKYSDDAAFTPPLCADL